MYVVVDFAPLERGRIMSRKPHQCFELLTVEIPNLDPNIFLVGSLSNWLEVFKLLKYVY